jgi:hypothetical protein
LDPVPVGLEDPDPPDVDDERPDADALPVESRGAARAS